VFNNAAFDFPPLVVVGGISGGSVVALRTRLDGVAGVFVGGGGGGGVESVSLGLRTRVAGALGLRTRFFTTVCVASVAGGALVSVPVFIAGVLGWRLRFAGVFFAGSTSVVAAGTFGLRTRFFFTGVFVASALVVTAVAVAGVHSDFVAGVNGTSSLDVPSVFVFAAIFLFGLRTRFFAGVLLAPSSDTCTSGAFGLRLRTTGVFGGLAGLVPAASGALGLRPRFAGAFGMGALGLRPRFAGAFATGGDLGGTGAESTSFGLGVGEAVVQSVVSLCGARGIARA